MMSRKTLVFKVSVYDINGHDLDIQTLQSSNITVASS